MHQPELGHSLVAIMFPGIFLKQPPFGVLRKLPSGPGCLTHSQLPANGVWRSDNDFPFTLHKGLKPPDRLNAQLRASDPPKTTPPIRTPQLRATSHVFRFLNVENRPATTKPNPNSKSFGVQPPPQAPSTSLLGRGLLRPLPRLRRLAAPEVAHGHSDGLAAGAEAHLGARASESPWRGIPWGWERGGGG